MRSYVPVHMEFVHQKSFCFDLDTDEPGLYTADSSILRWPYGKIPVSSLLGRRNHRASWLDDCGDLDSAGFAAGWQDLLIHMHRYGIPRSPYLPTESCSIRARNATFLDNALAHWGRGRPRCSE